jgi:hypothetical protein
VNPVGGRLLTPLGGPGLARHSDDAWRAIVATAAGCVDPGVGAPFTMSLARRPDRRRVMTPRRVGRHAVSPADARAYLSKPKAWLEAAVESLDAGRWDVAAGSAVTAGISACDAITGALVGQRAGGEHIEALSLLATGGDDGRYAARQLSQLLRFKTPAQYDQAPFPDGDVRKPWSWPAGLRTEPRWSWSADAPKAARPIPRKARELLRWLECFSRKRGLGRCPDAASLGAGASAATISGVAISYFSRRDRGFSRTRAFCPQSMKFGA